MRVLPLAVVFGLLLPAGAMSQEVTVIAAGSLKAAVTELGAAFERATGVSVAARFGASGLLRKRIEEGDLPHVFASANMKHPQAIEAAGLSAPVILFARNRLCAIARGDLEVTSETLLDTLLSDDVRVGMSTPKADPSGDCAIALYEKADALSPGAFARLDRKAQRLTGGPDSPKPPEDRNTYGWVMESGKADIFLTYCTNALLARAEVPSLKIVKVPEPMAVGADYGLTVLNNAPEAAWRFAAWMLSPSGQEILADFGFTAIALPEED